MVDLCIFAIIISLHLIERRIVFTILLGDFYLISRVEFQFTV